MRIRLSGNQIEILTPAKVNLFLEVLGRREDGFHELETIMSGVSLFDTLLFRPRSDSLIQLYDLTPHRSRGSDNEIPLDESNLIYKAIAQVRNHVKSKQGVDVWITKRIPIQAGLGGASGNAAGALVAANLIFDGRLDLETLKRIAGNIGSDVPFFLTGGTARCVGRGEQVTSLQTHHGIPIVLAKPPVGLSTADVFSRCKTATSPTSSTALMDKLSRGKPTLFGKLLFNRLETAASEMTDWIGRLKSTFARMNCLSHQMSGSGSTYFGVFSSKIEARKAANCLSNQHRNASIFACETLNCCQLPNFLSSTATARSRT